MPFSSANFMAAGESVCCISTSAPWSTSALAASRLLARIEPGRDPDHLDLDVGVDRLGRQVSRVDAHHHLGDRERGDVADGVGLGHLAGDQADDVAALVEAGVVGGDVGRLLEAGGVLELHVGIARGHLDGGVHEPERGGEDDAAAGRGQLVDDALGVRPLGHVLDEVGVDLVAELLLDRLQPLVVLVAPAVVADRPDVDEADLGLGLRLRRRGPPRARTGGKRCCRRSACRSPDLSRHVSLSSRAQNGKMLRNAAQAAAWNGLPRQAGASASPSSSRAR